MERFLCESVYVRVGIYGWYVSTDKHVVSSEVNCSGTFLVISRRNVKPEDREDALEKQYKSFGLGQNVPSFFRGNRCRGTRESA